MNVKLFSMLLISGLIVGCGGSDSDENSTSIDRCDQSGNYEAIRIVASDGYTDDYFGASISVAPSGDYFISGATGENAAYIFERNNQTWLERQKIIPENNSVGFGNSVAMNDNTIMIGGYGSTSNRVQVYRFDSELESWQAHMQLSPSDQINGGFGSVITIYENFAFIGAPSANGAGAVYVFENTTENPWQQTQIITLEQSASNEMFGRSITANENFLVIGAPNRSETGTATVFEKNTENVWEYSRELSPEDGENGDFYGYSLDLSSTKLAIGSPRNELGGSTYLYDTNLWEATKLTAESPSEFDIFGWSVSIFENTLLVGAPNNDNLEIGAGAAYIFKFADSAWQQTQTLNAFSSNTAENDAFGASTALTCDLAFVGIDTEDGFNQGAAYLYSSQ